MWWDLLCYLFTDFPHRGCNFWIRHEACTTNDDANRYWWWNRRWCGSNCTNRLHSNKQYGPGTAVFGAGPIVDSSVAPDDSVNDDSMAAADSLKEMFLAGAAEQVTEEVPDKE